VERILEQAVLQIPGLVVLVLLSMLFLRSQKEDRSAFHAALVEQRKSFAEVLREQRLDYATQLKVRDDHTMSITQECHRIAEKSLRVHEESIKVMARIEARLV